METSIHTEHMIRALDLAMLGQCTVSPNPMVGCVLVNNGKVVGEGYHDQAGQPHAEVNALAAAGILANDSTAYVTLEPCCHHGRTPPCTKALIAAGVKKVYVACIDPNPKVAGLGIKALKEAGIEVELGLEETKATALNKIFFHYIKTKKPFVIAKWAMSLDGKSMTHPNDDRKISCRQSYLNAQELRHAVDAILIGSKTAIADDPLLTVRLAQTKKQPLRIVLSRQATLPLTLKIFSDLPGNTLIVTTAAVTNETRRKFAEKNIELLVCQTTSNGEVSIPALLESLGKRQITSLLVEGGETVLKNFFKEELVNQVQVYLAPIIIGDHEHKKYLNNVAMTTIDRDYFFTADFTGKF